MWCAYYDDLGSVGILNCGATANAQFDIDAVGDMPTGCSSDYMVAVTATNNMDQRTFSAYGATTIDLGAPGENVYLPSLGGDTQFANMSFVYEQLSIKLKNKIKNLKAIHVYQSSLSVRKLISLSKNISNKEQTIHSLVKTHPENKKKCVYINPIRIEEILGLTKNETIELLEELMIYVSNTNFQYRHKWKLGDFVIWDNRILMHKANGDYNMNEKRYLYRIMIENEQS